MVHILALFETILRKLKQLRIFLKQGS